MDTLSHYTGGADGWGDLVSVCADCGETVARYACDGDGNPVDVIFDDTDTHECRQPCILSGTGKVIQ